MRKKQKMRLGDLLIAAGLLTDEQLNKALIVQKMTQERLGEILVKENFVTEQDIIKVLSQQLNIPYVDLALYPINMQIALSIPEHMAYKHHILALEKKENTLLLAMSDPLNLLAIDDIEIITKMEVNPVIVKSLDLEQKLQEIYQETSSVEKIVKDLDDLYALDEDTSGEISEEDIDSVPVVRLVNSLLQQAVRERASDIHLEPQEKEAFIRFRIDGVLLEKMSWPKHLYPAIVSRIKISAAMDIAERRIPQDGRSRVAIDKQQFDLRVSTLPTIFGEKVVIRVLRKDNLSLQLEELGFSSNILPKLHNLYKKPHGMLLVTGPTGSGKTTTLYSILKDLNSGDKNIITVEDPVEYQLARVNQVQVNVKAGLTFANALRSFLRQDPDIIMVGELRDTETVRIGIQAALTGHFVLSTLHTNDTAGTVARLLDMGIEPFLITSSLIGVVAQRLARKICSNCSEAYYLEPDLVRQLGLDVPNPNQVLAYKGKGCPLCNGTGYRGRTALGEILVFTKSIRELVLQKASAAEIEKKAVEEGMTTLYQSGLEKILQGVTTVEEILRVTYSHAH